MAEQLSQAEIDALRNAVRSGGVPAAQNVVLQESAEEIKVIAYDFRKPKLLSAERMVKLQLVHQTLLKNLQSMLFSMFKIAGESKLSALEQVSYGEYLLSLAPPTYLLSLQAGPDVGPVGMELSPPMGQILLDMLLGGDGVKPAAAPPHEFSAFEMEIMRTLSDRLLSEMESAWKELHDVTFEVNAQGISPEQVQIAPPDTPCLIAIIDLRLNEKSVRMHVCYPFSTLQVIFERAEASSHEDRTGRRSGMRQSVLRVLQQTPLPASVELGRATMTAGELSRLCAGDVIKLDQPIGDPLRLHIGPRLIGQAYVGEHRGRLAACLSKIVQPQKPGQPAASAPPPASARPTPPPSPPPSAAPPARPAPRPPVRPAPDKTKGTTP